MIDENTIKSLQKKVQEAHVAVAKAEVEEENARKVVTDLKAKLKEEYGVSTGTEIKEKLASLEAARESLLREAEEKLEQAGA